MRLILFDIDQTLMETGGVGMRCMTAAVRTHLGQDWNGFATVHPDGKTDPQIALEALAAHGWDESHLPRLWPDYIETLRRTLGQPDDRRRLKPGVQPLLATLAHQSVPLGLLTGNLEPTARLKLQALNIDHYFPLGAFGSDASDRRKLGPVAIQRAEQHFGCTFSGEQIWVIGDTPLDIQAAHAAHVQALGVATGSHSVSALAAAGADAVLQDLSDLQRVLDIIL